GFFGYWFKGKQLDALLNEFKVHFSCPGILNLKDYRDSLKRITSAYGQFDREIKKRDALGKNLALSESTIPKLLSMNFKTALPELKEILADLDEVSDFSNAYKESAANLKLHSLQSLLECPLGTEPEEDFA